MEVLCFQAPLLCCLFLCCCWQCFLARERNLLAARIFVVFAALCGCVCVRLAVAWWSFLYRVMKK